MSQNRRRQQWLPPIIAICLMLMLLPHLAAAPTTPVYSTNFEDVTKKDANQLNMGIDNLFAFEGDGGATMWMEGLDRKTPNVNCHSGSRCVGMELTDITKSRRSQFVIANLKDLVGDEVFVWVWLYLPADWQLHLSSNWYEIVNPFYTDRSPYLPYSAIHIVQSTTLSVFDLSIDYRDISGAQRTLYYYGNFSLPRGRWFQVQYYVLRSSTDGILKIWFDGTLVLNRSGLQTKGPVEEWHTNPAKIYYDANDTFSPYRIWVDDLAIYKGEPIFVTTTETISVTTTETTTVTSGVPGFPLESLLVGSALGLLFAIMRRRQRSSMRVLPDHCLLVPS